jgi:hypothetical protein
LLRGFVTNDGIICVIIGESMWYEKNYLNSSTARTQNCEVLENLYVVKSLNSRGFLKK